MKLYLCDSADDEPEDSVSEEEHSDEIEEDEESASSNEEDEMPKKTSDEKDNEEKQTNANAGVTKTVAKVNGKSTKAEESENSSDGSVNTDDDDEVEANGIKAEPTDTKPPNKTKLMQMASNVPARLKNTSTETMVLEAIKSLNERGGSSAIAVKKYVMNNYPQLDGERTLKLIKKYIKKALSGGILVQSKGTGVGGSFKVSAKTSRLEEQKERKSHKKLKKSKIAEADEKTKTATKTTTKTKENGVKKEAKTKRNIKAKVKVTQNGTAEATVKGPKASAALPKVTNIKQTKPTTASKEAKPSTAEKSKVVKQNKNGKSNTNGIADVKAEKVKKATPASTASAHTLNGGETAPVKAEPKGKAPTKKQPTTKGKASAKESVEIGSGDADTMMAAKKTAGRKAKAK
ncbi:histone H1 [Ceratitis capitata]|uniref:histone H1 n=1 Tax=Ceratitis capitata TaxID=7213 RepID=UPI000A112BFB|nr:histone H1 [Ceratitis capitata]